MIQATNYLVSILTAVLVVVVVALLVL